MTRNLLEKRVKMRVYLTHLSSGPHRIDYYQFWHGGRRRRCNELRQVWYWCPQEFQTYGRSVLAFSTNESYSRPYNCAIALSGDDDDIRIKTLKVAKAFLFNKISEYRNRPKQLPALDIMTVNVRM